MSEYEVRMTGTEAPHSARLVDAFSDELRKSGVNCKGYGILFKYPMLDPALTIEAKGIYCYICSYAGSDATAFPGRDKIRDDLQMCKDAYYKHYQLLLDNDYIRVEQKNQGGSSHGFLKNIYEIVESPAKFSAAPLSHSHADTYARIRSGGLHDTGFGYIPRAIMVDKRLSVKAKALYGYYRSFSGAGDAACPEKKDLLYHLGISAKLYERLMAELVSLNYITVVQRHVNGRLSVNDIRINTAPDETAAVAGKSVKVLRTNPDSREDGQIQDVQKQDTQKWDAQMQEPQKQDTQKPDIIRVTKKIKNNVSQNQSDHQQISLAQDDWQIDAQKPFFFVDQALSEAGTFPENWLGHRQQVSAALERMADAADAENGSTRRLFVEALTDLLCAQRPVSLTGERVNAGDVYDHLLRFIRCSEFDDQPRLYDLPELAAEAYETACTKTKVKNPLGYMKACIWSALKTGDAGIFAQVAYDMSKRRE